MVSLFLKYDLYIQAGIFLLVWIATRLIGGDFHLWVSQETRHLYTLHFLCKEVWRGVVAICLSMELLVHLHMAGRWWNGMVCFIRNCCLCFLVLKECSLCTSLFRLNTGILQDLTCKSATKYRVIKTFQ